MFAFPSPGARPRVATAQNEFHDSNRKSQISFLRDHGDSPRNCATRIRSDGFFVEQNLPTASFDVSVQSPQHLRLPHTLPPSAPNHLSALTAHRVHRPPSS